MKELNLQKIYSNLMHVTNTQTSKKCFQLACPCLYYAYQINVVYTFSKVSYVLYKQKNPEKILYALKSKMCF